MGEKPTILLIIVMSFIVGFIIADLSTLSSTKEVMKPFDAALVKCEMNLPRNQSCVLVYEAKVKQ